MKRLVANNIAFVKEHTHNGITYEWSVSVFGEGVSGMRSYCNQEEGRTVIREYHRDRLPSEVRKYIQTHASQLWYGEEEDEFKTYIYV